MKTLIIIMATLMTITAKGQNTTNFEAERISRTAQFTANAPLSEAFPLFGPYDERKWVHGWDPQPIYPKEEVVADGVTFKTGGSFPQEPEYLWRVIKFDPSRHFIEYLVTTANRQWSISVSCQAVNQKTEVEVTYAFTSLNELGKMLNREALSKMYSRDLKDWEEAINYFFETGKALSLK